MTYICRADWPQIRGSIPISFVQLRVIQSGSSFEPVRPGDVIDSEHKLTDLYWKKARPTKERV